MVAEQAANAAAAKKEEGNVAFKAGNFPLALNCYSDALILDDSVAVVFCNRAMTWLKLSRTKEALEDCNSALNLNPDYAKAFYWRSEAWQRRGRPDKALDDLQKLLVLQPKNQDGQRKLQDLRSRELEPGKTYSISGTTPPPDDRRKEGYQRISVTERARPASPTALAPPASRPPPIPDSSYQFITDWHALRGRPDQLASYFLSIDPQNYASLMGTLLDGAMLSEIISCLPKERDYKKLMWIFQHLFGLPSFPIATMFLSAEDKENLSDALQCFSETEKEAIFQRFSLS